MAGYGKLKKGGASIVQGQVFLKDGGGGGLEEQRGGGGGVALSNLFFSRFIICTFRKYFSLCKIVLCI